MTVMIGNKDSNSITYQNKILIFVNGFQWIINDRSTRKTNHWKVSKVTQIKSNHIKSNQTKPSQIKPFIFIHHFTDFETKSNV